jgi:AcrR family transcriptional regulator
VTATDQRGPGRPRNPAFDRRILDAALIVYAERGWTGFTMEEVARQARIGKAALYLRWSSKEELLVEAFTASTPAFMPEDAGRSARELLLAIGTQMRQQYTGHFGRAMVRLGLDADQIPELYRRVSARFYRELEFGIKALDGTGISDDRPPGTDSVALIEALSGAVLMRTLFTSRWDNPRSASATDAFVHGIVDLLAPDDGPAAKQSR